LNALLERPGELVAREELVRRLWPQGTFVDFDHGLNSAISRLREVLDDSANVPRFIETIPRRGYRLLVPVEGVLMGREPVPSEAAGSDPPASDSLEEHHRQRVVFTELVPGLTLAQRLRHGALPVREALDICRQIAERLEAAHEAGIVHRDLNPANINVGSDGQVKLLNFGLAKGCEPSESAVEPTLPAVEATREGTVLEPPAYMSPEQALGHVVDRRTDIWAFGCCLYECLTGRSAFKGKTIADARAAVLTQHPDWSALSDAVPGAVRTLLRRSLAKDVRQRLQHIGDARLELEEIGRDLNEPPPAARQPRRAVLILLGGAALMAIATGLAAWLEGQRPTAHTESAVPHLVLKIEGETADNLRLQVDRFFTPFAVSPDGTRLVFRARGNGRSQLFLRELSGFGTRPIPGTEMATTPFFSPDGQWIGFWRAEDRILRKVSVAGGSPIAIAQTDVPTVALWTSNDEIVIDSGDRVGELWSIPASGGTPTAIAVRDRTHDELISLRARVPGSSDLLVASTGADGTWLDVLARGTGKRRRLLRGGSNVLARYTATGHLVFSDGDALRCVPVNERFEPVGDPTPVLDGIDQDHGHSNVALSDNGTVIYIPADHVRETELVWLDRQGNATPVPGGRVPFASVALSPDGREVAGDLVEGTKGQVWVFDLERRAKRLLVSEGDSRQPIWSRDGRFITYWSTPGKSSVFRKRADGTGSAQLLMHGLPSLKLEDWSPDGRSLLFREYTSHGDTDLWIYSDGKAMPFLSSPSNEASARFSPDGRFIAFEADDGGISQVYVQPFPGPGPRTVISTDEGDSPEWIDGARLLYLSAGRMMVADVQTQPDLRVGQTRPLNERHDVRGSLIPSPDGRQFLMLPPRSMEGPIELHIILNWFQDLERLAPHPQR
jgi:Tol biopolymer transport system component/DNA-binding winged helix-turn-helix (wHTH) protein